MNCTQNVKFENNEYRQGEWFCGFCEHDLCYADINNPNGVLLELFEVEVQHKDWYAQARSLLKELKAMNYGVILLYFEEEVMKNDKRQFNQEVLGWRQVIIDVPTELDNDFLDKMSENQDMSLFR